MVLVGFRFGAIRCCGGAFTAALVALSKRAHASRCSSISPVALDLAMKIHAVLEPYCNLMHDIKVRVDAMQKLAKNDGKLSDHVAFE